MEQKVFAIKDLEVKKDGEKVYLTGYANTKGHEDSYGDIPTSFGGEPVYIIGQRMKTNPVCFVDHRYSAANIAGSFVELEEDDIGLRFKLLLRNLSDIFVSTVKDAVSAYISGFGHALSIGGEWFWGDEENPSHLTKAIIHEISLVGLGADSHALTTVPLPKGKGEKLLPLADMDHPWDKEAAVKRNSKALAETDSAFPYACMVDEVLTVVPRGIFEAAAGLALVGDDGKESVCGKRIVQYFEKMGLESPFEDGVFRLDDFSSVDERTLEGLLKKGVRFSGEKSKAVISALKLAGLRDEDLSGLRDGDVGASAILDKLDTLITQNGGK